MDVSRGVTEAIKVWLALGGAALGLAAVRLSARRLGRILLLLTLVATLNYARWGPKAALERVDSYDLMHYYLAARYFDELGYYDLYPAVLLVDHEHGPYDARIKRCRLQDAAGYRLAPLAECLERGRSVREQQFTPTRWQAFEHDFLALQRGWKMSRRLWRDMIQDRGFNATPAWITVMSPLVTTVPVEAIKWLAWLDVVLLAVGLGAVRWAYGRATMLWAWLFLMVTYSLRWPMPTQVFARYDWVAALMVAMALLRKSRPFWAGGLVGFAALVRLFPIVWLFGPAARALWRLIRPTAGASRFDREGARLAAGALACLVVLEGAALLNLGIDTARTHAQNIAEHVRPEQLSSRRIGFALAYSYRGELEPKYLPKSRKLEIKDQARERWPIVAVLLGLLGFGTRRLRHDQAFALGFLPFFWLATASYYYYVTRITLVIWHAEDLSRRRNRVGLATLFGLEVFANWAETVHPGHRVYLIGRLAWGLLAYSVLIAGWLAWDAWREPKTDPREPA
ncbi:MAG: DUF2029 domain-containing protein [Myxococcales bacterium FL481]|nr:MAG: DUF2029 domain-containing protein [Myxococcales bacterium FL481]